MVVGVEFVVQLLQCPRAFGVTPFGLIGITSGNGDSRPGHCAPRFRVGIGAEMSVTIPEPLLSQVDVAEVQLDPPQAIQFHSHPVQLPERFIQLETLDIELSSCCVVPLQPDTGSLEVEWRGPSLSVIYSLRTFTPLSGEGDHLVVAAITKGESSEAGQRVAFAASVAFVACDAQNFLVPA